MHRQPTVGPLTCLFDGRAYRLGTEAFSIGAELGPGDYGLLLDGGQNGISRRHCSIRRGQHGLEVIDHSRYGTRLNGHTIDAPAILQTGDVISIGEPDIEFHLIAEVDAQIDGEGNDGA